MESVRPTISAVVITRNEGKRIEECLRHLTWVDEIIVVDNGSTDQTVLLAHKYGSIVVNSPVQDFSQLRMIGKNKTKSDWIIYVDADEEVTDSLRDEIRSIISSLHDDSTPAAYYVLRRNFYLGHEWPYRDRMIRLFRKKILRNWVGRVHETALVDGKIGVLQEVLTHRTHRLLEEMIAKTNEWSVIEANLRFASGHPPVVWWRFLRVMVSAFTESFISQGGFRVGAVGWIESIYQAFSMFITYAKLWELQRNT